MGQINWIKTFDRVDWDFVSSASRKFGYGDKFIHMIKVAYTNIQFDPFTLMRGVPPGCPLSVLLYIIAADVLVHFIDKN